jgi:hypothetical protein
MEGLVLIYCALQAYLSLPEGAASAAGLKAMMTDHYNLLVCVMFFSMIKCILKFTCV